MGWTQVLNGFPVGVSHDDDGGATCSQHSSTRKGDVNWVTEIICVKTITVCEIAKLGKHTATVLLMSYYCMSYVWFWHILSESVCGIPQIHPSVCLPLPFMKMLIAITFTHKCSVLAVPCHAFDCFWFQYCTSRAEWRLGAAVHLLLLCASKACKGTTLPFAAL